MDKNKFGGSSRPVGMVGYTNNSIIDDVSLFEGQTLQDASVTNIGINNSIPAKRSKSKRRQENESVLQNEITPVVLGLATSIKEK